MLIIRTRRPSASWSCRSLTSSRVRPVGLPKSYYALASLTKASGSPASGIAYIGASTISPIPLPAAGWLLGSALVALGFFRRRFAQLLRGPRGHQGVTASTEPARNHADEAGRRTHGEDLRQPGGARVRARATRGPERHAGDRTGGWADAGRVSECRSVEAAVGDLIPVEARSRSIASRQPTDSPRRRPIEFPSLLSRP